VITVLISQQKTSHKIKHLKHAANLCCIQNRPDSCRCLIVLYWCNVFSL